MTRGATDFPRPWNLVAFGLAVFGLLLGIGVFWIHASGDPMADANAYYLAGGRLNAGIPLYHQPGATIADTYLYPPLLATLFRPLALLPREVALGIWEAVIVLALLVTLRGARRDRRVLYAAGVLALPIGWAVAIGQAEVVVAALLSLGTPFSVALAGHLKIFPWIASLFWLVTGDRPKFVRFVAWSLGLLVLQFVLEPRGTLTYLELEWLQPILGVRSISPYVVHPVVWVAVLVVLVALLVRFRRHRAAWPLAVVLVVLSFPRLLVYQLLTLLAAFGGPRPGPAGADAAVEPSSRPLPAASATRELTP